MKILSKWRRQLVVSETGHITADYTEFSNQVTLQIQFTELVCRSIVRNHSKLTYLPLAGLKNTMVKGEHVCNPYTA